MARDLVKAASMLFMSLTIFGALKQAQADVSCCCRIGTKAPNYLCRSTTSTAERSHCYQVQRTYRRDEEGMYIYTVEYYSAIKNPNVLSEVRET